MHPRTVHVRCQIGWAARPSMENPCSGFYWDFSQKKTRPCDACSSLYRTSRFWLRPCCHYHSHSQSTERRVARSARLHAVICFVIPSRSCNPENMGMSRTINPWLSARSVQSQPIPVGQSVPSVHGSEAGRLLTGGIPSARFTI